jgi:hypothetical protein
MRPSLMDCIYHLSRYMEGNNKIVVNVSGDGGKWAKMTAWMSHTSRRAPLDFSVSTSMTPRNRVVPKHGITIYVIWER